MYTADRLEVGPPHAFIALRSRVADDRGSDTAQAAASRRTAGGN